jgi:hypothetical protein
MRKDEKGRGQRAKGRELRARGRGQRGLGIENCGIQGFQLRVSYVNVADNMAFLVSTVWNRAKITV